MSLATHNKMNCKIQYQIVTCPDPEITQYEGKRNDKNES